MLKNGTWIIIEADTNIKKSRCSDINKFEEKEKYYNISLKSWWCINFENKKLGGNWDGEFVNFFAIRTKRCENSTYSNITCLPKSEIEKSFKSGISTSNYLFSYLYMEAMPTMDNFHDPLKSTLINRYEILNLKITKKHVHTFKQVEVLDDHGWIFSDFGSKSTYSSENLFPDFTINDDEQSTLFGYFMYFGKKLEVYNRSYVKVQEVIASIGGFSKFFHIIVSMLYGYISDIIKNLDLNRNFYITEFNSILQSEESKINVTNNSVKYVSTNKTLSTNRLNNKKKIGVCYIFKNMIFRKKNDKNLSIETKLIMTEYDKLKHYHESKLDIVSYMNIFKEFELLKKITLDDTQQKAIQFIKTNYDPSEYIDLDNFLPVLNEYINRKSGEDNEINKRFLSLFKVEVKKNRNTNLLAIRKI